MLICHHCLFGHLLFILLVEGRAVMGFYKIIGPSLPRIVYIRLCIIYQCWNFHNYSTVSWIHDIKLRNDYLFLLFSNTLQFELHVLLLLFFMFDYIAGFVAQLLVYTVVACENMLYKFREDCWNIVYQSMPSSWYIVFTTFHFLDHSVDKRFWSLFSCRWKIIIRWKIPS